MNFRHKRSLLSVATASGNNKGFLAAFGLPGGKILYLEPAPPAHLIRAVGDPSAIVTADSLRVNLADPVHGKIMHQATVPGASANRVMVNCLTSSPDGERILCGLSNGRFWFLRPGQLQPDGELDLGSRLLAPRRALYTPDGRHVMTLCANGTVCVWRLNEWAGAEPRRE